MSETTLILLFLVACIPTRLLIAYTAYYIETYNSEYLLHMAVFSLLIGFGFLYNIFNERKIGAFHQKVWWQNYRYIHACLFLGYGFMSLNKIPSAYVLLFFDAMLGMYFFVNKRIIN